MTAIGKLFFGGLAVLLIGGVYLWYHFSPYEAPQTPEVVQVSSVVEGKAYQSQELGLSFTYAPEYTLTTRQDGFEGEEITVLTLINASTTIPDQSEGPVAIAILKVPNPKGTPLQEWIKAKSISNFSLSRDKKIASTTVAGETALSYRYSGLYENDAVVVLRGGSVYLFFVSWITGADKIRADFKNMLASVTFIP